MSELTPNLGLFKYIPTTDGKEVFSIEQGLNSNWDILDVKGGAPETVVSGSTWYRRFTDGWKEQGGTASIGSTWVEWQQPVLTSKTSYGTISYGPMYEDSYSTKLAFKGLNANNTPTSWYDQLLGAAASTTNWINWKFPVYLRFRTLTFWNLYSNYNGNTKTVIAYTDSTKTTEIGRTVNNNGQRNTCTIDCDDSIITDNLYLYFPDCYSSYTPAIYQTQISAYELTSTVNNITFPSTFSNTDYGFSLGLLGSQVKFVSATNKTISSISLNNVSDSCTVYWKAWGY